LSNLETKYPNALSLDEFNNDIKKDKGQSEQKFHSYTTTLSVTYDIDSSMAFDIDYSDEDKLSEFPTWKSNYDYKSLKSKFKIAKNAYKIVVGIDKFDGDRKGSDNTTSKDNKAMYISSEYSIDNQTSFELGARKEKVTYTYSPNIGASLSDKENLSAYNIGINHILNAQQSIYANYNKSFQAPDIDRFFNWGGTFNTFIKPEEVKTLNIGFNDIRDNNKLKLTVFRANLTDEIYYYSTGFKNTNIDKSYKYGLELFDKYYFNDNLYTSINYNYIIAKIDKEDESNGAYNGKYLPGVSKHNATINIGLKMNKYLAILTHKYRSKAYASDDFANNFTQKQKAYNLTNLSVNYSYDDKLSVFAKVENLLDKQNGMWIKDDNIYVIDYGRTYYAGVEYRF
jgi:iron complex outermembrane receptor protein